MLKNLANYGGDCYPSIIVQITFVSLWILDDWNDGSTLKLFWHSAMHEHFVEKMVKPIVQGQRSVEKVLSTDVRVIAAFTLLHTENCIYDIVHGDAI